MWEHHVVVTSVDRHEQTSPDWSRLSRTTVNLKCRWVGGHSEPRYRRKMSTSLAGALRLTWPCPWAGASQGLGRNCGPCLQLAQRTFGLGLEGPFASGGPGIYPGHIVKGCFCGNGSHSMEYIMQGNGTFMWTQRLVIVCPTPLRSIFFFSLLSVAGGRRVCVCGGGGRGCRSKSLLDHVEGVMMYWLLVAMVTDPLSIYSQGIYSPCLCLCFSEREKDNGQCIHNCQYSLHGASHMYPDTRIEIHRWAPRAPY